MVQSLIFFLSIFLFSCAPGLAPNGMSWQEYHVAKYSLRVAHSKTAFSGCQELGTVKGVSDLGVAESKDDALDKALLLHGNALRFENLRSQLRLGRLIGRSEIHYADARVFRCEVEE